MKTERRGDYQVADQALEVVVGMAASKVEGVAGLHSGVVETLGDFLGKKKPPTRGIKISGKESKLEVTLHLVVNFGYVFNEVGRGVQKAAKEALESMTGLKVKSVNVLIKSVNFPEEPSKKQSS